MVGWALRQVFTEARYVILASAVGLAVFILATWLPNFGLVWQIAASGSVPLADKVEVLAALVGSIATNFTVFSALSTITIAALFGANRSEEHTSELQSLMRISYADFCL